MRTSYLMATLSGLPDRMLFLASAAHPVRHTGPPCSPVHLTSSPSPPWPPLLTLQVRVLQCVASAVDLLGDRLRPHLHTICSALPQVCPGVVRMCVRVCVCV